MSGWPGRTVSPGRTRRQSAALAAAGVVAVVMALPATAMAATAGGAPPAAGNVATDAASRYVRPVPGTVEAWGGNFYGQLGDGTTTGRPTPGPVTGLGEVTAIAGNLGSGYAVRRDGTVRAWGANFYGQLGDGTTTNQTTPVQVSGLRGIAAVASGGGDSGYALSRGGRVWAWGANFYGQLGDGTTTNRTTPVLVSGLRGIIAIAGGAFGNAYALRSDGTVWAWGSNFVGELGDGTTTGHLTPARVSGLTGITAIAGGGNGSGYALRSDGTVWAWGANQSGQLGDGTTTNRLTAVRIPGLSRVAAISGGGWSGYALRRDGTVWAWGDNLSGQLGDGTTTSRLTPGPIPGLARVTEVVGGGESGYAVRADGTVRAWGENIFGQLGDGTTISRLTPVPIAALRRVVSIAAGTTNGDPSAFALH